MKTLRYLLFSVYMLALLTNCSKDDNRNAPEFQLNASDNLDDLDYQLYSLILEELFTHAANLVVSQPTQLVFGDRAYFQSLINEFPEMDTTSFTDYFLKNDTVYFLENKFNVASAKVSLVSAEEIHYIFNNPDINKGWKEFYRRFPNSSGEISFSRIGYSSDKTHAMVEMASMYSSLGGEGRWISLKLVNNEWTIVKSIITWMS